MNASQTEAEQGNNPILRTIIDELEQLVDRWLRPYIDAIRYGRIQPRPKVINDAVWGSIRLHAWEVAILDSYLLQRLRLLRQLGVVHWVYPSAGHSRLEHSLGVLHQMDALIHGLERNSGTAGRRIVDDVTAKLLRVAALMHDCGHCAMSHVPEQIIKELPGVRELITYIQRKYRARKAPSPSEAFAAVFIRSPAFRDLLLLNAVGADFIKDVDDATSQIAGFLLGGPVIADRAFLTLLMNGAYDADKLDYMPRDCMMAGVPCAVDVRRVIEIIRCVEVPIGNVPEYREYAKWAGIENHKTIRLLTLSSSGGARALDEIATTRAVLYDKIYYHHKVRALEVMVRQQLMGIAARSVSDWLELTDDDLFCGETKTNFRVLRERRLLKRAFTIVSPVDGNKEQQKGWRKLVLPENKRDFAVKIQDKAREIAQLLKMDTLELDAQSIAIDFPNINKIELDQNAFVGDSIDEVGRANAVQNAQRPEAGKRAARSVMYVFAPESAVLPAFLATRELIATEYKLSIGPEAYRATRIDPEAIQMAEKKLESLKYPIVSNPEATREARIVSHREMALETFLKTAWPRIEACAVVFGRFQSQDSPPISPVRIADYLRQFETESLARSALRALEAIDFKDRAFFSCALASQLERILKREKVACVCPFGETGDSSALLAYLMADIPAHLRRPVVPLELALEHPDEGVILLWDDFCGLGGHSKTALKQWLNLSAQDILKESLVRELSEERKEAFRKRKLKIVFALGMRSGLDILREFLTLHQLDNVTVTEPHHHVPEASDIFSTERIIQDKSARDELSGFLKDKAMRGFAANLTRNNPWTQETLEKRLLGYGNGAHLLVFFYNVPTATLTSLWADGQPPSTWWPLFPRRSKPAF